jgi:cyclopropane fatty-acyl-phospholipid synthase-like methyltransferase
MFTKEDVVEYYNSTQIHYVNWWKLKKNLSLHYGIWTEGIKTFDESLTNTNLLMLKSCDIKETYKVMDAGCGVGGAAFFIHKMTNASITGISLSQKQIALAKETVVKNELSGKVDFFVMDFTQTSFRSKSFDVIWACESVCHASQKSDFIKECFRLLKKGGQLIMCDFFLTNENQEDKNHWIDKWKSTWAVTDFVTLENFKSSLEENGFESVNTWDYTDNIKKSASRMLYASIMATVPSIAYKILHPKVSRFARDHYKCGYYQYMALRENLWRYNMIWARKSE